MRHPTNILKAWLCMLAFVVVPASAETFHFVAIGDTAYNPSRDYPVYEALILRINAAKPAFTIHVGDTWGVMPCTEAQHRSIVDWFAKYDHPVIYTPGDNEWADCREPRVLEAYVRYIRKEATPEDLKFLQSLRSVDGGLSSAGYDDPLGSLALIRRIFFATAQSQGARTMALTRQPDVSVDFRETVENTRWTRSGVVFATIHVPGSNNGFLMASEDRAAEAIARNRANVDWIKSTFAEAGKTDAKAVVIALQAAVFSGESGGDFTGKAPRGGFEGPYHWVIQAIRDQGARFGKPVLVINGDFHDFIVDRPFMVSQGEAKMPLYGNITRLQVFGAPELKAVKVGVDTETPWVFSFEPLHN
jgi:hypothetical protein